MNLNRPTSAAERLASIAPQNPSEAPLTKTLPAGNGNPAPTPTPGTDGIPKNAIVHGACGSWWTGAERSHASCCCRTFSSLSAFDQHRKGGRCNEPAAVGLAVRTKPFGTLWGWPAPEGGYARLYAAKEADHA